jgi:glycerol-3-phosphate acyltransferase PlsX
VQGRFWLDYSEYGGAPLVSIKGVCIVSHGSSNANAIKNAIRVAMEYANSKLNHTIEESIAGASRNLSHHQPNASTKIDALGTAVV